jgi:ATP-dependent Clp protease ATP-binding subunit ClpC
VGVFERFTERARQVVVLAQDEARALNHNYIGTEHLLLGILREADGLGTRVLLSLDVNLEQVRDEVRRIIGLGDEPVTGQIPFTPRAKKVMELGLREALALGHNYIGTDHLLLGLIRERGGVGMRVLFDFGLDEHRIRNRLIEMLGGEPGPESLSLVSATGIQPEELSHRLSAIGGRIDEIVSEVGRIRRRVVPTIVLGWALFAIALGIGILIGWAIWGA